MPQHPMKTVLSALAFTTISLGSAHAESLKIVTTIPPLAAIASDVLAGIAEPELLIKNGGSPHSYSLRPSDAAALAEADYILWIGEDLELFIADKLDTLAPTATRIEAMDLPGITVKPYREAHDHSNHNDAHDEDHDNHGHSDHGHSDHGHNDHGHSDHGHSHDDHDGHDAAHQEHDHSGNDPHIWLSPDNALAIAQGLANAVGDALSPEQAARMNSNLANFEKDIAELKRQTAQKLSPFANQAYLTFHDAYQYFEAGFDLDYHGSVTISPEVQPGAASLSALREEITQHGIVCVFSEPQFEPRAIRIIAENLPVKTGILDPLGNNETARIDGYQILISNLADGYAECFGN